MMFQSRKQKEAWEAAHPAEFAKLEQYGILDGSDDAADQIARRVTTGQPEAANSNERGIRVEGSTVFKIEQAPVDPRYRTLRTILDAAFNHAATGKGKERHARDLPFDGQPMMENTRLYGPGFPLGQAAKKTGEAMGMFERGQLGAAEAECLGAINYLAGCVAWMREQKDAA